jgi:hypothetical protein
VPPKDRDFHGPLQGTIPGPHRLLRKALEGRQRSKRPGCSYFPPLSQMSLFPPTFVPDVPVPSHPCPGCSCSFPPLSRMFLFPPAFVPGGHNRSYSTFPCGLMFSVGLWVFHQQPLELSFLSVGLVLDLSQHDSIDLTHTLCQVPGHRGHKTNKTHCSCPGAG